MDKPEERTPYLSEHLPREVQQPRQTTHSQRQIFGIVEVILDRAEKTIEEHILLKKYLNFYSNNKTINNINEVNTLFFKMGGNLQKQDKQEQEPKPLLIDSLLPISADIDAENTYKKSQRKINVMEESSVRFRMSKPTFAEREEKYRKLDITEASQEDPMTKEMRRMSEENRIKENSEKKEKEKSQKLLKMKQKGTKDQKISYDYNGKALEIKTTNKANLIASLIDGNSHFKTEIVKQAINDPNPTTLEGQSPNKAKIKKLEMPTQLSKRKDEIQFSAVRSLADQYKTTYGVKYVCEGKTYEQKKRLVSTRDLQRSLSQRKLSKQQFEKIKRMNMNNREQFQESLKKSTLKPNTENKHLRTQSEVKQSQVKSKKRLQTIHVSNPILKNKLLEKVVKLEEPPPEKQEVLEDKESKIRLDSIDNFNLEYLKTGGTLQSSTSREFFDRNSKLPKISHTTLYTHTKPKGRERIKDANQILRDLRKRFQEKLRV